VAKSYLRPEELLGKTLAGKYEILEVHAGGAFGTVFKAHQYFCKQFMRPVAVKVSHEAGLSEDTAPRLFGDALILARLLANSDHDERRHLVQIHDMGLLPEHDHRAYLAMEYVEGRPLLAHMHAAGRISVASGLRYIKEICHALALVHHQGAVHRDLSPDNILLDKRGVVRVVDFGLAAYTDPQLGFAPGSMGRFTYMAPETLHGRSTPASDVYSLGLLMYELFTGGGPHLTAPWSTDDRADHREEHWRLKQTLSFAPPSAVQNEIRYDYRWLDELIPRCLDLEPERRFADAGRLLEAIEACELGQELPPLAGEGEKRTDISPFLPFSPSPPLPSKLGSQDAEAMFREVRRLLAARAYDQVIDRLDVFRPAEWSVVDLMGARTLRALGQAYLGRGDLKSARECLEQLRDIQKEQALLSKPDYAAALSDLLKCYRGLGLLELAQACQDEAKRLL
jgi:eukaryotic-like serine/threonine-protein kinase